MLKKKRHYLTVLLFAPVVYAEQTVLLKLEGIKDSELSKNVRIFLSQLSNDEADGSERYQHRVQETVDKALRALGYYNTQYRFVLTPRQNPAKDLLTLYVELDKQPVKLDEREVELRGQAADDPDFHTFIQKDLPAKDAVLNHETYEGFKSNLEKLAQTKGYFDGQWLFHRLEVYPQDHIADWRLGYDSGERYRYGEILFKASQIREDYLTSILKIKQGDPYYLNDLSKMSSDFSSSGWFSSVIIEPEMREQEKEVALNLQFYPRKKNEIEVGIGYASDVGARLQLNWKKPWINSRGNSLELNSFISKPEQNVEMGYKIPLQKDPLNHYYQISGGLEREDNNDTRFTGAHLGFQRFWNYETGWNFSLGVKARYDSFEQGNDKHKTLLLYPTASLNRKRTDGNRFPLWGDSQKLAVNWGSKVWGSDVDFYTAKASSIWVRTLAHNHRFYVRGEIGYLKAGEFGRIPPALRYFAGGDMSVRGFGYEDISPKDQNGKLTGGSHLFTSTLEYQYQVYQDWWAATFYDTGFASTRYSTKDLHSGAGIGVRWASPIGAIKFDLATPVRSPNDDKKGIQFYIGLGSEL